MKEQWNRMKSSKSFFCLLSILFLVLVASVMSPSFRTLDNFATIIRQSSTLIVLSTGLTAVLLTGGIDLSVGSTAAFAGCLCAQLLKMGVPAGLIFPVGLGVGLVIGLLNGFLVAVIKLPPFIATYATNWVLKGLSIIVMSGAVIYDLPAGFTVFGTGYVGKIPIIVIFALVIVAAVYFFLQKTTLGRDIYAYGSNREAARYSAVNTGRSVYMAFGLCSMTAAVGGLLMTARLNAAEAAMGDAYGLQTVAAVVIGGTSMLGGEGGVLGTLFGGILLTIIVNIMNLLGTSSLAQPMVVGAVILLMVLMDTFKQSRDEKFKKKAVAKTQ
ncbi:ABC transporter permease [Wansuia hejianensis]|nr:ABC transporter permease [Wansuia hejianensis]